MNRFLGTHLAKILYSGTLAPNGGQANFGFGGTNWGLELSTVERIIRELRAAKTKDDS
jgi:hypothetical protein